MEIKNTILVIDDERPIQRLIEITLNSRAYKTIICSTAAEGLRTFASLKPDLVILDLGLTDMDGKDVIRLAREWSQAPIIVCSVRNDDAEIIKALDLGANDYITKPFNPDVLVARVRTNLRNTATHAHGEPEITNGPIRIDLVRHEVFMNDNQLNLTPRQYDLLHFFITNRGKMLTHQQILKAVWGEAHMNNTQYLRVYMKQLRNKLEEHDSKTSFFTTEVGIGYRMEIIS